MLEVVTHFITMETNLKLEASARNLILIQTVAQNCFIRLLKRKLAWRCSEVDH